MGSDEIKDDFHPLEINKAFLEKLFKRNVTSFALEAGSNPGDNYMSIMHAAEVNFKNGDTAHIVIKCVPNHPTRREFIEESNVFKKEFFVYDFWIPTLEKMQKEIGVTPLIELPFPPYVGGKVTDPIITDRSARKTDLDNKEVEDGGHNYIVMTDLRKSSLGYKMADRCKGADYSHCQLVIKELAKIHALGWAYKQRKGLKKLVDVYPHLVEEMFTGKSSEEFRPMMADMLGTSFDTIKKGLGSDSPAYLAAMKLKSDEPDVVLGKFLGPEGPNEGYIEGLLRIKPEYDPNYNSEPWLLVCHGDCWLNNMLFKYDEETGKPEKVALVDLQLFREGCPTSDLVYFFFSSTSSETRKTHEESLIRLYHDKFLEHCTTLKVPPLPGFNLSSLKRRYRRAKVVGFTWSMPLLTFVLKEPEKVVDLEQIEEGADINDMFSNVTADADKNVLLCKQLCEMTEELYEAGVL